MKKIFAIAALAALSVSCTGLLDPKEETTLDGTTGLGLEFWCSAPNTRATKPGEDVYNENKILSLDYFIFTSNASDAAAVKHERFTIDGGSTEPVKKKIDMGEYKTKYGESGFVYALVNMPANTEIGEETLATLETLPTLAVLQALPVPTTTFEQLDGGKFKAQDSFVMASELTTKTGEGEDEVVTTSPLVPFTLEENKTVEVDVPLSRRAAKITIDINVADYYVEKHFDQDKINGVYEQTWFPTVSNIQVYMMNFTDEGTMDGAQIDVNETTKFKTYNRRGFNATIDETSGATVAGNIPAKTVKGTPFYSYPAKWDSRSVNAPFIKVILEWSAYKQPLLPDGKNPDIEDMEHSELKVGNKEFYYKITIPDEVDFTSNYWYHINLDLSVLGSEADDVYVTVPGEYSVVAWSDPEQVMGTDLNSGRYLTVEGNKVLEGDPDYDPNYDTFKVYADYADIPIITSHPVKVVNASSSYATFVSPYSGGSLTYSSGTNASNTGSNYRITPSEDMTYVKLEHEMVKGVGTDGFASKDVAPITYTFTIQHTDNANYSRAIKVIQYPSIYISQLAGGDVFIDGYFQSLQTIPEGFGYAQANSTNLGGYRSRNYNYGNSWNSTTTGVYVYRDIAGTSTGGSANNGDSYTWTPYGRLSYDNNNPKKTTLVTVSAFSAGSGTYSVSSAGSSSSTFTYVIADPRIPQNWTSQQHLIAYLTAQTNASSDNMTHTAWTEAQEKAIKVGTHTDKNYIAPAFLISSRWGRPGDGPYQPRTLEEAEQRCATYQEAGYPAGRWRLPTEAEIYFVFTLQRKSLLDDLFTAGTNNNGYWASSGNIFGKQQAVANATFRAPGSGTGQVAAPSSVRCVYDYWYWEETGKLTASNKYNPKP